MRTILLTTFLLACGGPTSAVVGTETGTPTGDDLLGCGDGEKVAGEACDDGNALGGDGCTDRCEVESGQLEVEPNDSWDQGNDWDGGLAHGGLSSDEDVDCWTIDVPSCGSIEVRAVPPCNPDTVLTLHDPSGIGVATGTIGPDGCAVIDPAVAPGADQTPAGPHTVCVSEMLGPVRSYAIEARPSPSPVRPIDPNADLDGDGLTDRCDPDRDGDGVDDVLDNCPEVPNGPDMDPLAVSADGFIRDWLILGPLTGYDSPGDCEPSADQVLGDDALAVPTLGDDVAGRTWFAWFDPDDRINLRSILGFVGAPRESYQVVWVYAPSQQDVTLSLGADDGVRSWLNGVEIHNVSSCQGTNVDQFQEPATLNAGWNRLMVKVRDNGGGWGLYARFLDAGGDPVTGLEVSIDPGGSWFDDQGDQDGDGTGDACDATP